MKKLADIIEATGTKVHPDAVHVSDAGNGKYKVHAVGKNFSDGIKVGEHLSDSELDDFSEMGGRIKHVKPMQEEVEPEADMNILVQLRKCVDILEHGTQGGADVVFGDKQSVFVEGEQAKKLVEAIESLKPEARAEVAEYLYQSHDNLMGVYHRLK